MELVFIKLNHVARMEWSLWDGEGISHFNGPVKSYTTTIATCMVKRTQRTNEWCDIQFW